MSEEDDETEPSPSSSGVFLRTDDGYSVMHPQRKERESILRAQMHSQKVSTPREIKRRIVAKKIVRRLGGGSGEDVDRSDSGAVAAAFLPMDEADLRGRRVAKLDGGGGGRGRGAGGERRRDVDARRQRQQQQQQQQQWQRQQQQQRDTRQPRLEGGKAWAEPRRHVAPGRSAEFAAESSDDENLSLSKRGRGVAGSARGGGVGARLTVTTTTMTTVGRDLGNLSLRDLAALYFAKRDKYRLFAFAETRATVALADAAMEISPHPVGGRDLFVATLKGILVNAVGGSSGRRRRLNLSNEIFWSRVGRYYGGRAALNAAGFVLHSSSDGEPFGFEGRALLDAGEMYWQPLDVMEDVLRGLGRRCCSFSLPPEPLRAWVDGARYALESMKL